MNYCKFTFVIMSVTIGVVAFTVDFFVLFITYFGTENVK